MTWLYSVRANARGWCGLGSGRPPGGTLPRKRRAVGMEPHPSPLPGRPVCIDRRFGRAVCCPAPVRERGLSDWRGGGGGAGPKAQGGGPKFFGGDFDLLPRGVRCGHGQAARGEPCRGRNLPTGNGPVARSVGAAGLAGASSPSSVITGRVAVTVLPSSGSSRLWSSSERGTSG